MTENLDATDWAILDELQQDGRIAYTELARRVNLSASATTERVRRLEAAEVITGYRAEVDLERAGYAVLAVVRLKYPGSGIRHEPLRRLLGERSEILECLRTTGDDCYVLKVATTSMAHLEEIVDELAQFGSTTTNIVLRRTLPFRGPRAPRPNDRSAGDRPSSIPRSSDTPTGADGRSAVTTRVRTARIVRAPRGPERGGVGTPVIPGVPPGRLDVRRSIGSPLVAGPKATNQAYRD